MERPGFTHSHLSDAKLLQFVGVVYIQVGAEVHEDRGGCSVQMGCFRDFSSKPLNDPLGMCKYQFSKT